MSLSALNRRDVIRGSLACLAVFKFGTLSAFALSKLDQMRAQAGGTPVTVTPLRGGISMLSGPGGNVAVLPGADGVFAIDSGAGEGGVHLLEAIRKLTPQPLKTLANTHWHFDHTDGNGIFRKAGGPGFQIVAQENVRKRMAAPQNIGFMGVEVPASAAPMLPDTGFAEKTTLTLNGETVHGEHLPDAHTDTDAAFHFTKANVIHCGDLLFSQSYPFIDGDTGGHIDGMMKGVHRLMSMGDAQTIFIAGHGKAVGQPQLQEYLEMLAGTRDAVAKAKKGGMTLEQATAAKVTGGYDEKWGGGTMNPPLYTKLLWGMV